MQPLAGLRILDFSSPLPGPLARLFRAEAGAEVIKIECPGTSEPATYFVAAGAEMMSALPLPIEKAFRDRTRAKSSPSLGVDNHLIAARM